MAISLAPDEPWPYWVKARALSHWQGNLTESQRVLESLPIDAGDTWMHYLGWSAQYRQGRDFGKLLEFQEAATFSWITSQLYTRPMDLERAETLRFLGRTKEAVAAFDAARITLENELDKRPDDFRLHSALGMTLAGLGRKAEAIAAGKKAIELQPVERDAYIGPVQVQNLALIYTWLGELDQAVEQPEYLLSIPAMISAQVLRLDPRWDPLRDHPRFQALVEKG